MLPLSSTTNLNITSKYKGRGIFSNESIDGRVHTESRYLMTTITCDYAIPIGLHGEVSRRWKKVQQGRRPGGGTLLYECVIRDILTDWPFLRMILTRPRVLN